MLEGKEKVVSELRAAAKKADTIYIASDPDREGGSDRLAHHEILGGTRSKVRRVLFNEITKSAVLKAHREPARRST